MSEERTFKTCEILASLYAFPGLLAARTGQDIIESFDRLREVTPQIAGFEYGTDQMSWCELANALKPVLARHFPDLAQESFPNRAYWSNVSGPIDAAKVAELRDWVIEMEEKYGEMLTVPCEVSRETWNKLNMPSPARAVANPAKIFRIKI